MKAAASLVEPGAKNWGSMSGAGDLRAQARRGAAVFPGEEPARGHGAWRDGASGDRGADRGGRGRNHPAGSNPREGPATRWTLRRTRMTGGIMHKMNSMSLLVLLVAAPALAAQSTV